MTLNAKKEQAAELLPMESLAYPSPLKQIPDPPSGIYVMGGLSQSQPNLAIVGTRKATGEGKLLARRWARKLSEAGATIVSGLAMGIDAAAHEGALEAGGRTIAVLACGLDNIYPRQNEKLAKRILGSGGALVSEYSAGTPPYPVQFLARNRIVSGLSEAVIVIEAPEKSGALVTARLAVEQGREVFVVPGSSSNFNYRGSHKLIRDGARLVGSVEDVLEDLDMKIPNNKSQTASQFQITRIKDERHLLVLKTIQSAGKPLGVDNLVELTKLEPQIINQAITFLIVMEIVKETGEGYIISR